tara:strand:- start:356 stop:547 length:192 start_codon:yes stop_codon:yes gene_type:complete
MNAITGWYWTLTLEQQIGMHLIFGALVVFSGIYLILGLEALLNRRGWSLPQTPWKEEINNEDH